MIKMGKHLDGLASFHQKMSEVFQAAELAFKQNMEAERQKERNRTASALIFNDEDSSVERSTKDLNIQIDSSQVRLKAQHS